MSGQIKNQELKSNEMNMDIEELWNDYIKPDHINIKNYCNRENYNCKVPITKWEIDIDDEHISDNKLHEWLTADLFVKPYYDFDMACKSKKDMEEQFKIIMKEAVNKLSQVFDCTMDDMGISTCNRKKKKVSKKDAGNHYFVSIHIIVNNHYCIQSKLEYFNIQNKIHEITGYDKSVYSNGRNFRMIYQSKAEKDSKPFTPYNHKEPEDIFKHIIQYTSDNAMYPYEIKPCIIKSSPPVSPPSPLSPSSSNDDFDMEIKIKQLKKLLDGIETRYEYDDWWKVGSIIAKESNYSPDGFKLFKEWSEKDESNFNLDYCKTQWKHWNKNRDKQEYSIGTLKKWYNEENDDKDYTDLDNVYQHIYFNHPTEPLKWISIDGKFTWDGKENIDGLVEYINKELIFIKETGETIIIDNKEWYLKKKQHLMELFAPKTFTNIKNKQMNPANIWFNHKDRREVLKIGFDPTENPDPNIFNIWTGMRIKKNIANEFDVNDCQPLLDHIKNRWCNCDEDQYNYVLNWLAHIVQKPWIKMGVVLCLRSKQGAGKGIILNIMRKIIGDKHYFQCNNLDQLTGNFNGIGEGKILTNLDEAFWGKDKKKEGMLKNLITEETKLVNKKNKENYIIEDFCNYLVSTNNDCFIPASENERRFYALEVSDELSGIQTKDKKDLIDLLLNCPPESFAKYLYNRDISTYNPRIFNKTPLLQEQVEHSWCSVRKWWFNVINNGGFTSNNISNGFCEFGEVPESMKCDKETGMPDQVYGFIKKKYKRDKNNKKVKGDDGYYIIDKKLYSLEKDFIYKNYEENCNGYKLDCSHFWKSFKKYCIGDLMNEKKHGSSGSQKRYLDTKDIVLYQKRFNELQLYDYEYGCEVINDDDWD